MNKGIECKIGFHFCGSQEEKEAFVYKLKQLGGDAEVVINENSNCWDVIVYNRFFYDREQEEDFLNDEIFFR
ncbi:hypothetical protein [Hippea maritima]|uniref:Uncharacterized protein n=1 Tax=Hippea maritima (strain ATCC 700847 / DSM 10411 / MH2) TaxID=760142 RepID=F2LTJ0_HIPMA|nr:hypothetical protein [Hippea maritima]AEA33315.1 hypothetical protein Hipma_0338 [Hippea maritima DSM 10411]